MICKHSASAVKGLGVQRLQYNIRNTVLEGYSFIYSRKIIHQKCLASTMMNLKESLYWNSMNSVLQIPHVQITM